MGTSSDRRMHRVGVALAALLLPCVSPGAQSVLSIQQVRDDEVLVGPWYVACSADGGLGLCTAKAVR